jgi:hypothetical protein
MIIIPRKNRLYTSIINKGSIVWGAEGRIMKIEENAANNDRTEKP